MKSYLRSRFNALLHSDEFRRVFHTAWQVGAPILFAHLVMARSSADVKAAFVFAAAPTLAAVKALYVARKN